MHTPGEKAKDGSKRRSLQSPKGSQEVEGGTLNLFGQTGEPPGNSGITPQPAPQKPEAKMDLPRSGLWMTLGSNEMNPCDVHGRSTGP